MKRFANPKQPRLAPCKNCLCPYLADSPRRFRFSLITLIVAVNVAGLLVWVNMRWRRVSGPTHLGNRIVVGGHIVRVDLFVDEQGVPVVWRRRSQYYINESKEPHAEWTTYETTGTLGVSVAIALIGSMASALSTEFLVRKFRKAKRRDG